MNSVKDKYESFSALIKECKVMDDYFIISENVLSPVSIVAIHGGGIEACTTEVAKEVSRLGQYKLYTFVGMRNDQLDCKENLELHVTSNKFLDTECLEIIGSTIATVSIHGADEAEELTYVGGKNFTHAYFIKEALRSSGFNVPDKIRKGLEGYGPLNICNRNMKNMGVQLEMSQGLRAQMFGDNWKLLESRNDNLRNARFNNYCSAIWAGTQRYLMSL